MERAVRDLSVSRREYRLVAVAGFRVLDFVFSEFCNRLIERYRERRHMSRQKINPADTRDGILRENITIGAGTKYPLGGTLTLPVSDRPVPAVVLVHGSGSSNRDEKVMKLTPFRDLAEGLAGQGIGSLRYDKRSFVHGLKMIRDKSAPLTVRQETIEDAVLAAEMLRQDPRVDKNALFLIGHSMGGMLAPRIDAEGGNFRGLVIMAGSPRRLEDILVQQLGEMMDEMPAFARKLSEKKVHKLLSGFEGLYDLSDEEAMKRKFGGGTTLYYFKEMGVHDVPSYLAKTEKPMLFMQGDQDFQVKADIDFRLYKELLAGRDNVTFRLYEGLNHVFVSSLGWTISQSKKEYGKERHIGEEVIGDIADWIRSICRTGTDHPEQLS